MTYRSSSESVTSSSSVDPLRFLFASLVFSLTVFFVFGPSLFPSASLTALLMRAVSPSKSSLSFSPCALPETRWRTSISVPQTSFACSKLGVSKISGIPCVRESESTWRKASSPKWPLRIRLSDGPLCVVTEGRTYSPMFSCRSFFDLKTAFESLRCIPRRYSIPIVSLNSFTSD